jgi:thymidylate synthase (FAD)
MELVRHRVFSFAQESTRYCNYSNDKFNNELTFIIPSWSKNLKPKCYTPETSNEMLFVESCLASEKAYLNMLGNKATPQEARQVLPNALKTEINMCGYLKDWKHFFELRTAPNAHPDMVVLAKQLEQLFNKQNLWKNSTY